MLAFLEETILSLQKKHTDLSQCIIILPSKRAGGFFKKYLQKYTHKTAFSPRVISIEEFIETISGLSIIPSDELLIRSYQAYQNTKSITDKESFEDYAVWANALLNDFSEVDRYLVDTQAFFDYLFNIKDLEHWAASEEQSPLVKKYLQFWAYLNDFYTQLQSLLEQDQLGYQGMVYRKAAEDIEHYIVNQGKDKHVFIGFNALNTAEQHIIQELLETGNTEVFWDIDAYFYNDPNHSASQFIREYVQNWKYYKQAKPPEIPNHYSKEKDFTIVSAPNDIAQVKYVGALLADFSVEKLNKTAVVLADETLLLPFLYSLPPNVEQANVTMGLSLDSFPATNFFELLLKLHLQKTSSYYYKKVMDLLNHPLSQAILKNPDQIIAKISQQNRAYLSLKNLLALGDPADHDMLKLLFGDWETGQMGIQHCKTVLRLLLETSSNQWIQRLVWEKLTAVFDKISLLATEYNFLQKPSSIHSLFREIAPTISLDFAGDAYTGLQIMGVLETRGLDFENVIMLSVNEGVLPAGKSNASFATYDLKATFKLPLYTEKDAVYTYHFYRLLHRAKEAILLYNSFSQGLHSGEKSRYLLQLEIEKPKAHRLQLEAIASEVSIRQKEPTVVEKTQAVETRLKEIAGKYFSPSSLTNYLRNPLDFYYQKILNISETEEVEETIAYNTLGTIVHEVLENLYKPFEGIPLDVTLLKTLKKNISEEVSKQFERNFKEGDFSFGKNLIIFEVAKRYVGNLIDMDISDIKSGNTLKILHLEAHLRTQIDIPELPYPVFVGGKIDRVDLFNDQVRVIDYKTGKVGRNELEIADWNLLATDYKYSKAFQVLCYALLIQKELSYQTMEAGVISFKNLASGFIKFAQKGKPKVDLISEEILDNFQGQLKKLILEICDTKIPFVEKELD